MRERVIRVETVQLRGRAAVLEVEYVEPVPPGRVRLWLSRALIRLAGRLARMRVRVAHDEPKPLRPA